jgi:hypothetical protein
MMSPKRPGPTISRARRKVVSRAAAPDRFLIGIGGAVLCMVYARFLPEPPPAMQAALLAGMWGLTGGCAATGILGVLKLKTKYVEATSSFAVFLLLFWSVMATGAPEAWAHVPFFGSLR